MPSIASMIFRITLCTSTLLATSPSLFVTSFSTRIPKTILYRSHVSRLSRTNISSYNQAFSTTSLIRTMSSTSASEGEVKKRVLVPIAEDSEEIETTCITDVLARFGAEVVVASVKADGDLVCKMSRGVKVK